MTDLTEDLYVQYSTALARMDKPVCVQLVLAAVSGVQSDSRTCTRVSWPRRSTNSRIGAGQPDAIWREHVRSEITRTVIECCYPAVVAAVNAREQGKPAEDRMVGAKKRVMIVLPSEEFHELGARMGRTFSSWPDLKPCLSVPIHQPNRS